MAGSLRAGWSDRSSLPRSAVFIDNPCDRPFPKCEESAELPVIETMFAGSLEPALLEATGVSRQELEGYLTRRQGFLAEVVRADLRSLQGMPAVPATALLYAPKASLKGCRSSPRPSGPKTTL